MLNQVNMLTIQRKKIRFYFLSLPQSTMTYIMYRVSQNKVLTEKNVTKIEHCGAKFYHEHDLGGFDPA